MQEHLYGWLRKQHRTHRAGKQWARRYFWVDEHMGTLGYAKGVGKQASCALPLADITCVDQVPDDPCAFSIRCPPLHLTVAAVSAEQQSIWVEQIGLRRELWRQRRDCGVDSKGKGHVEFARGMREPSVGFSIEHTAPRTSEPARTRSVLAAELEAAADEAEVVANEVAAMVAALEADSAEQADVAELADVADAVVAFEQESDSDSDEEAEEAEAEEATTVEAARWGELSKSGGQPGGSRGGSIAIGWRGGSSSTGWREPAPVSLALLISSDEDEEEEEEPGTDANVGARAGWEPREELSSEDESVSGESEGEGMGQALMRLASSGSLGSVMAVIYDEEEAAQKCGFR